MQAPIKDGENYNFITFILIIDLIKTTNGNTLFTTSIIMNRILQYNNNKMIYYFFLWRILNTFYLNTGNLNIIRYYTDTQWVITVDRFEINVKVHLKHYIRSVLLLIKMAPFFFNSNLRQATVYSKLFMTIDTDLQVLFFYFLWSQFLVRIVAAFTNIFITYGFIY